MSLNLFASSSAVASSSNGFISAIGGGAAPFGPSLDLRILKHGALLKSCTRHFKRNEKVQGNRGRSSRELSWSKTQNYFSFPFSNGGGSPGASGRFPNLEGVNKLGKLYCRTGFNLQIHTDGKVNGTRQEHSRFGVLEFLSVAVGLVSIKGKESNRYLCMNRRGRLYGSVNHTEECIFMEKMLENYYNTYTSCKYSRGRRSKRKWYVALNKRGRPRKGNQSRKKQKFTQFLVLHFGDEPYRPVSSRNFHFPSQNSRFGITDFSALWRQNQRNVERSRTLTFHGLSASTPSASSVAPFSFANVNTANGKHTFNWGEQKSRNGRVRWRPPGNGSRTS